MATRPCPVCGSIIPRDSRYCEVCGRQVPIRTAAPTLGQYVFPRVQVDSTGPTLYRDARWVELVVGVALAVVGAFLLLVGALVAGLSSGAGPTFEYVFLVPGAVLLGVGILLVAVGLARTL